MVCRSEARPFCFLRFSWRHWAVIPVGASVSEVGLSKSDVRWVGASGPSRLDCRALGPRCRLGPSVVWWLPDFPEGACVGLVGVLAQLSGIA